MHCRFAQGWVISAAVAAAGCSSSTPSSDHAGDATREGGQDASSPDGGADGVVKPRHDAGRDAQPEGTAPDASSDVTVTTTALFRVANWSPDAPPVDVCFAPHGTSNWTGPALAASLGAVIDGTIGVEDAAPPYDAGRPIEAAVLDATHDAAVVDGAHDALEAGLLDASKEAGDAASGPDASRDATTGDAPRDSGGSDAFVDATHPAVSGVPFPRMSPYVTIAPGHLDVRVVAGGAVDCGAPILPDSLDLAPFSGGTTTTLAVVGDVDDQGSDPAASLVALPDDTRVASSKIALRFINAVPSVTSVSFASGTVATASAVPYLAAAQFGSDGVDTDAGALDSNDYLVQAPIAKATWSLIDANGGTTTLVTVVGGTVSAGRLATVVAVGGESGPLQANIGVLVCTDRAPIAAGKVAACELYQGASAPVCPGCP